ncbi:MAG: Filament induced by cAMP protein [Anaerolineales bacterium]|nr:Filament induced by cAMP protein [Anaerolineales bacterium]
MRTLAQVFGAAREEALRLVKEGVPAEPEALRRLDPRARMVLALFAKAERITTAEAAEALGLSARMTRSLLQQWVADGWLVVANPSNRARAYALSATYRRYIGGLSAMPGEARDARS